MKNLSLSIIVILGLLPTINIYCSGFNDQNAHFATYKAEHNARCKPTDTQYVPPPGLYIPPPRRQGRSIRRKTKKNLVPILQPTKLIQAPQSRLMIESQFWAQKYSLQDLMEMAELANKTYEDLLQKDKAEQQSTDPNEMALLILKLALEASSDEKELMDSALKVKKQQHQAAQVEQ